MPPKQGTGQKKNKHLLYSLAYMQIPLIEKYKQSTWYRWYEMNYRIGGYGLITRASLNGQECQIQKYNEEIIIRYWTNYQE